MNKEERTYKISGNSDYLDRLEKMFSLINCCCQVGASRAERIFIDGDGSLNFRIYKDDELLKDISGLDINKYYSFFFNEGIFEIKEDK
jgi:hypothetical protein